MSFLRVPKKQSRNAENVEGKGKENEVRNFQILISPRFLILEALKTLKEQFPTVFQFSFFEISIELGNKYSTNKNREICQKDNLTNAKIIKIKQTSFAVEHVFAFNMVM